MNPDSPFISVIIPNYNRGDLLQETLDSLLQQNYPHWEALVVDDGSDDNSEQIGEAYQRKEPRITFLKRDRKPSGAPTCRNIGTSHAKGDYLIFLDSDDLLTPFALSQRAEIIAREPDNDFWVFPMLMFRDNPAKANTLWNIDNKKPDLHRFLILDAPWQTSGPVWRKSAVVKTGGFTEGLACWQDVDFHLKGLILGLKGEKYYNLPPDVLYRQHETQSISQGEISSPAKLISRSDIFRRHTTLLLPVFTPEIIEDLKLLGGNIAIGAAKAVQPEICLSVIRFGYKSHVFPLSNVLKLYLVLLFYLLRLNRIPAFDKSIRQITKKYRQDSNIGKNTFIQTPEDGK